MSFIEPGDRAVGRVFAEALATGPVTERDLRRLLSRGQRGVDTGYRAGYALLISRYADLFSPTLVHIADQALPRIIATLLHLNPQRDAGRIAASVAAYKEGYSPMMIILNEAYARVTAENTPAGRSSMEVEKARILQSLLAGGFPPRLAHALTAPAARGRGMHV